MATLEDLHSDINSQTLETLWTHRFVCFFSGSWDLHISGNGSQTFYVYKDRMYFVFLLPSLMWRSNTAVFSALEHRCACRITCTGVCTCHMCVCGSRRGRRCGLCVSLRQDWLVPETETRCGDPAAYCQNNRLLSRQLDFHSDHHMNSTHA